MLDELDEWMVEDAGQWVAVDRCSELRFGDDGEVGSRSAARRADAPFAGRIDRIDQLPDGTLDRHGPQDRQAD